MVIHCLLSCFLFQVRLPPSLNSLVERFAQHCHDSWALELIDQGYIYGPVVDETKRTHPNLCSFQNLQQHVSGF